MARDQFSDVVLYTKEIESTTGPETVLVPAEDVRVHVFAPGTTTLQTIFNDRTGGTTKANPFLTGSTGAVEFWAEYGDYDIHYEETLIPARISNKTFGWNSASGTDGAITLSKLASNSVDTNKVVDNTLTASDIAPSAIGSSELADNAVDLAALGDSIITDAGLSIFLQTVTQRRVLLGNTIQFATGILTPSQAVNSGPHNHGLPSGWSFFTILGTAQGASNSVVNRPASAQWGFYDLTSTQVSIELICSPISCSVDFRGIALAVY